MFAPEDEVMKGRVCRPPPLATRRSELAGCGWGGSTPAACYFLHLLSASAISGEPTDRPTFRHRSRRPRLPASTTCAQNAELARPSKVNDRTGRLTSSPTRLNHVDRPSAPRPPNVPHRPDDRRRLPELQLVLERLRRKEGQRRVRARQGNPAARDAGSARL